VLFLHNIEINGILNIKITKLHYHFPVAESVLFLSRHLFFNPKDTQQKEQ